MASAFYASFGVCRRKGFTKSFCYRKAKQALEERPPRRRKSRRKARGMSRKGSRCRRLGPVWSPALGKRVMRCVGGYR